jgi:hypothetical protein
MAAIHQPIARSATGLSLLNDSLRINIKLAGTILHSEHLSDIGQKWGPYDACGGPVPKICNRMPSHGQIEPATGKHTSLEWSSGAMASLRPVA